MNSKIFILEKELFIIRHGETDFNRRGIVQGKGVNAPLNEIGQKQADAFYQWYKNESFDKIYTSTLLRTHQTVDAFIAGGIPWEQLGGLDEIGWGVYEGQELTPQILEGFEALVNVWRVGDLARHVEQGESPEMVLARQQYAMNHIISQKEEAKVLVCMHGRAMRILLCLLTEKPVCEMDDFAHTNTALYRVRYDGDRYDIVDHYNVKHLEASGLL